MYQDHKERPEATAPTVRRSCNSVWIVAVRYCRNNFLTLGV
jgi:hypothetical protein